MARREQPFCRHLPPGGASVSTITTQLRSNRGPRASQGESVYSASVCKPTLAEGGDANCAWIAGHSLSSPASRLNVRRAPALYARFAEKSPPFPPSEIARFFSSDAEAYCICSNDDA